MFGGLLDASAQKFQQDTTSMKLKAVRATMDVTNLDVPDTAKPAQTRSYRLISHLSNSMESCQGVCLITVAS